MIPPILTTHGTRFSQIYATNIKVGSNSLPWTTNEIRIAMNQRYKALKRAREGNDPPLSDGSGFLLGLK